jgi:hypothetical protein
MMSSLEQLLRDAMDEHTSSARPIGTGMAHAALRGSHRTRRLQSAAIGGTSVAAAAVVVATATLGGGSGSVAGSAGAAAAASSVVPAPTSAAVAPTVVGATYAASAAPTPESVLASGEVSANDPAAKGGKGPAALDAVTLPDPAPGFPLRRWTDTGSQPTGIGTGGGTYWTKSFGLAVTPYKMSADGTTGTPTGPEVTILVVDGWPRMDGTDVGHTHVNGQAAVLVDYDNMHGLGFSAGKFSVQVWGSSTVTSGQLVALATALQGLPS